MNSLHRKRLEAICSWVEVNAPFITSQLAQSVSDGLDSAENQENILNVVRSETSLRACNYLTDGNAEKEEEPLVGFAFCHREIEKQKLLKDAVQEVKKKGLLKNALKEMEQDDLPLSEDEKIVMLLSSPAEMPALQQVVSGILLIPLPQKTTQRKGKTQQDEKAKAIQLPVRVVVSENQIVNVLVPQFPQKQKD